MAHPDGGMYGVKLISPEHLKYAFYTEIFDGTDGRFTLMNFSNEGNGPTAAANIPVGHRALVFNRGHLIWAIEFIGPVDHEKKIHAAHGLPPDERGKWTIHRPIRFLARMNVGFHDYARAPTRRWIEEQTGFAKRSYGAGHFYITSAEFDSVFHAVKWDWIAEDCSSSQVGPAVAIPRPVEEKISPKTVSPQLEFELPPINDAQSLLERILRVAGQPERNMEDVVKELLLRLGHDPCNIVFQAGRIDLRVQDTKGRVAAVAEVKRSFQSKKVRDQAMRQGFDYAGKTGARFVIITDCDTYEIYDRLGGLDHASMFRGKLTLTRYQQSQQPLLELLRPANLLLER